MLFLYFLNLLILTFVQNGSVKYWKCMTLLVESTPNLQIYVDHRTMNFPHFSPTLIANQFNRFKIILKYYHNNHYVRIYDNQKYSFAVKKIKFLHFFGVSSVYLCVHYFLCYLVILITLKEICYDIKVISKK